LWQSVFPKTAAAQRVHGSCEKPTEI
jgi:hypothetical protein